MQCNELFGLDDPIALYPKLETSIGHIQSLVYSSFVNFKFYRIIEKKCQVTVRWTIVCSVPEMLYWHMALQELVWSYEQLFRIVKILLKYLISDTSGLLFLQN